MIYANVNPKYITTKIATAELERLLELSRKDMSGFPPPMPKADKV